MVISFMTKHIIHHFIKNLKKIQRNAWLPITEAIRGTSKEKLYQELGLESLWNRQWFRKLCSFLKNFKYKSPGYLYSIIPQDISPYITKNIDTVPLFNTEHIFYKSLLFPSTVTKKNNVDQEVRNCENYSLYHFDIIKFIRLSPNSFFSCQDIVDIKCSTRLLLVLTHFWEHKFQHSFQDTLSPLYNCGMDVECCFHFFSYVLFFLMKDAPSWQTSRKLITKI